jgi:NADH dehydrogenase FAD-containing subunit
MGNRQSFHADKHAVVFGGGLAGFNVAKQLDSLLWVTVIEAKDSFYGE